MNRSNRDLVTAGLTVSGLAFAAYPALRPYGPEEGATGAADFGSSLWLVAHVLGMVGFVALAFSLRGAATSAPWPWTGRSVREVETRTWLALALLLPYYGAEAYGLNALGQYATGHDDIRVLDIADAFRMSPFAVTTFAFGLLALVLVGGRIAHGLRYAEPLARVGGVLAGLGLATYLPQYFGPPSLRIAHGAILGLGLVLMAVAAARGAADQPEAAGREQARVS